MLIVSSVFLEREVFLPFRFRGHILDGGSRSLRRVGRGLGLRSGPDRSGGNRLGVAGGSDLPDLEIVVPAAVVLAALEVEGDLYLTFTLSPTWYLSRS